jgi:hypothetical protein
LKRDVSIEVFRQTKCTEFRGAALRGKSLSNLPRLTASLTS